MQSSFQICCCHGRVALLKACKYSQLRERVLRHVAYTCVSGRGTTRAEDAQGTPTQSHTSPSILMNKDRHVKRGCVEACCVADVPGGSASNLGLEDSKDTPLNTCDRLRVGEVSRGEKMALRGTDSELFNTEYTLVYEVDVDVLRHLAWQTCQVPAPIFVAVILRPRVG